MDTKTAKKYERRAAVIKALAHPSRLYIVDRLAEHEHCVNELTTLIGSGGAGGTAVNIVGGSLILDTTGHAADEEPLGKLAVFAGVNRFPMRVKCAVLPWHAMMASLKEKPSTVTTEPNDK